MESNLVGTQLGKYEIQAEIGRGGMGLVYCGYDHLLERQVAIKVLFPEFATDENFVERFRREAQSAASLSHPNIVNVYDWGKYEGTYFIVMEEVQGRTLAEILSTSKQLTSKQAAESGKGFSAQAFMAWTASSGERSCVSVISSAGRGSTLRLTSRMIPRVPIAPTMSRERS